MDFLLYRLCCLGRGTVAALWQSISRSVNASDREPGKERPRLNARGALGVRSCDSFCERDQRCSKMAALGAFFLLANPSEAAWIPYSIVAVAVFFGSLALGHRVVVTA